MVKIILIAVVVVLGALFIFAAFKPHAFRVQRETIIQAPPEKIFTLINDFHQWGAWSPYEKLDPGMKRTYSGAAQGKGSIYAWEGNRKVGQGRMEITETVPASKILIQLDFTAPMKARNTAEFTLEPQGAAATKVTWAMTGDYPFLGRLMSILFSMDKMVGKGFEAGLADLKSAAEK